MNSSMRKILAAITAAAVILSTMPMAFASNMAESQENVVAINEQSEGTEMAENEVAELSADPLPYQDTSLSFEERAADLVARMTLEEKAAQTAAKSTPGIPSLGVSPYYYWREGIHGVARQGGATSFPSSLAMSNTWDRDLMFEIMDITSTEARGKNNRYDLNYWNPTINLARDPRWGRNEESYGEDPYLTAEIGGMAIKGMQGTDEKYWKTMSTLKHYAANNNEGERQSGTSIMNEKTLVEYYLRAFRDISENYNPAAVMTSYNGTTVYRNGEIVTSSTGQKIDYIASSANSYLVNDLLRRTYGFDGFVVGDCGAWDNAFGRTPLRQKLYPDMALEDITATMTVSKIIEAGSSLDCNSGSNGTGQVLNAVKEGLISEDMLDIVVYELFLGRMKTGEFDKGAKYQDITAKDIETEESNLKAKEAAEETWVLLENKNNTLPLKSNVSKVAVVGGYAEEVVLGDYSAEMDKMVQAHLVTPIDGITSELKKINPNVEVDLVGNVSGSTPLFNIKSIKLVKGTKEETVDLSSASTVLGMKKSGSEFTEVTAEGTAIIPNINFKDVSAIKIEAASFKGMPNVNVAIGYGSASQNAANIKINPTADETTYVVNEGVYNGATGGYTETRDMYITISASTDFTVENYKDSLDDVDYIIAYAGTTEVDSSESNDRKSIDLPSGQSHVQKICDEYPEKTIVVMQTVGQINVEAFKDKCVAMLWTSYNGQQQGTALGEILTGAVNPSGKLSTTWYKNADLLKMPLGTDRTNIGGIDYNFTSYELAFDINNKEAEYPGRTYQYYTGTPVYPFGYGLSYTDFTYSNAKVSKTSADANDTVEISVDVTNNGTVAGEEVVQLYIAVPGAGTNGLPIKQLKNFDKIELAPGETKTVTMELEVADVYFYDEATQKNYVVEGEYTAYLAKNSADTSTSVKFNVSGSIAETLKRVYSIPSGLTVYTATDASGVYPSVPANVIDAGVSVTLKNDKVITDFANNGITVTYTSANPAVATVDENGKVTAGGTTGVTTITVTASKDGSDSVTTTFPVVAEEVARMADSFKAAQLEELNAAYASCPQQAYETADWEKLENIYQTTKAFVESAILDTNIEVTVDNAVKEMLAIPKMQLSTDFVIMAAKSKEMENGIVDYAAGGIAPYKATATTISGTVTKENPYKVALQAISGGAVINSGLTWTVDKIDTSSRKTAEINSETGELTIYENGIYRVTAADYTSRIGGEMLVYVNLQLEAESAESTAILKESEGASGGKYISPASTTWAKFDNVKVEGLAEVTLRLESTSADSVLNVSMTPNTNWVIATGTATKAEGWAEVTIPVNENVMKHLTFDENGCAAIYVQVNKSTKLDYVKLTYNTGALKVTNLDGGKMSVATPFANAALSDDATVGNATLIGAVYNADGSVKKVVTEEIKGDTTELSGFEAHDKVTLFVWDGINTMNPLNEKTVQVYNEAQPKMTKIVYNFSDPNFDALFNSAENTVMDSGLGMIGHGGWNTGNGGSCKYGGVTYTFTRSLKGGSRGENTRQVLFTPDSDGVVTAFFNANTERYMCIEQDGTLLNQKYGTDAITIVQANVKAGIPVYVFGGGSNKELHGVVFETGKSVEVTLPTPTPEPTPPPVTDPFPEDQILAELKIEFENYVNKFDAGSKPEDLADGNKTIGNTKDGDIFYFGEQSMDNLGEISLNTAIRHDAGKGTATFYAVDMTDVDMSKATAASVGKLLTNDAKLGTVNLINAEGSWTTYFENRLRGFTASGTKGLFVKLGSDGKYAGNHDRITLTYLKPDASTAADTNVVETASLAAENNNAVVSIAGDTITAVDKYSGAINVISYRNAYGENVTFKKLMNANGMLTALVEDKDTGKTKLISSPGGTVWMNVTPTDFSESDVKNAEYKINDVLVIDDQMYLACDDGILITMPPCSKCCTLKKVCDFDIIALEEDENAIALLGADGSEATIALSEVRQDNIQADAAVALAGDGAILVDVRSAEEYEVKSVHGSINVPIDEFEKWIKTQSPYDTIIVYCGSGMRAAKAVAIANSNGFSKVYNLGSIDELLK